VVPFREVRVRLTQLAHRADLEHVDALVERSVDRKAGAEGEQTGLRREHEDATGERGDEARLADAAPDVHEHLWRACGDRIREACDLEHGCLSLLAVSFRLSLWCVGPS
jgi:hypothetical protein